MSKISDSNGPRVAKLKRYANNIPQDFREDPEDVDDLLRRAQDLLDSAEGPRRNSVRRLEDYPDPRGIAWLRGVLGSPSLFSQDQIRFRAQIFTLASAASERARSIQYLRRAEYRAAPSTGNAYADARSADARSRTFTIGEESITIPDPLYADLPALATALQALSDSLRIYDVRAIEPALLQKSLLIDLYAEETALRSRRQEIVDQQYDLRIQTLEARLTLHEVAVYVRGLRRQFSRSNDFIKSVLVDPGTDEVDAVTGQFVGNMWRIAYLGDQLGRDVTRSDLDLASFERSADLAAGPDAATEWKNSPPGQRALARLLDNAILTAEPVGVGVAH